MITLGQRVAWEYKIEAWDSEAKAWNELEPRFHDRLPCKLDPLPEKVKSSKVRLTILKSRACPTIKSFGVHLDTISPAEYFQPEKANLEVKAGTRAQKN